MTKDKEKASVLKLNTYKLTLSSEYREDGGKSIPWMNICTHYYEVVDGVYPTCITEREFDTLVTQLRQKLFEEGKLISTSYMICPNCNSEDIESNKDLRNPFIRCRRCGYYLRKGKE